jgi:hypothetical protein
MKIGNLSVLGARRPCGPSQERLASYGASFNKRPTKVGGYLRLAWFCIIFNWAIVLITYEKASGTRIMSFSMPRVGFKIGLNFELQYKNCTYKSFYWQLDME